MPDEVRHTLDASSTRRHCRLYVLSGRIRLILADRDITMGPGEVAEFDTGVPHWFGAAGDEPVESLSLLGRHAEHVHVRAAARRES